MPILRQGFNIKVDCLKGEQQSHGVISQIWYKLIFNWIKDLFLQGKGLGLVVGSVIVDQMLKIGFWPKIMSLKQLPQRIIH